MGFLDYNRRPRIMVVANGHPYHRSALMDMFESFGGMECFLVEHPVAANVMNPDRTEDVDAIVLYDMPGGNPWLGPEYAMEPKPEAKRGFLDLLDAGMPIVALHHAIAGWSTWDEYAEILGGRVLHFPGLVRAKPCADSGYRQDVRYNISAVDPGHPIVQGVPPQFEIEDEVYLFEVYEESIQPVIRSSFELTCQSVYSLARAMSGQVQSNRDWQRPAGSPVIGWTKRARNSALAYLQPGHGPTAYANPHYRLLVKNAIEWSIRETETCRRALTR